MNLVNIWGDSNANIYSDEATPTLTLENGSTSQGLYAVNSSTGTALKAENTSVGDGLNAVGAGAGGEGAVIQNAVNAGATVAPLRVIASQASQAVMQISGVFMSTASINTTAAQSAFIIPVHHESENVWGYLTASKGVA